MSESTWIPPLPLLNTDSAWAVKVRSPSFGRWAGHVGAFSDVGFRSPPDQAAPRSARVSTAAAAFLWSAWRIFVRGSHGSRASATAATRPPRMEATRRLRHIRPGLFDELLRERLLERDELAAEDG